MNRVIIVAVLVLTCYAGFAYCEGGKPENRSPFSFVQSFIMGDEYMEHQDKLQKIEDSYKKGEITKDKYLELKSDAEKDFKAQSR